MVVVKGNDGTTSGITPVEKYGVWGDSFSHHGVIGTSANGVGIRGESDENGYGVWGSGGIGVRAYSNDTFAGFGAGVSAAGPIGVQADGFKASSVKDTWSTIGVKARGDIGMQVQSIDTGVMVQSIDTGVMAWSFYAVHAMGEWTGVLAENLTSKFKAYLGAPSVAGDFYDDIYVHGRVRTDGGGFQIDHPLDPANKYLSHSFVNSPDMKNIYDGVVILDANGKAEVDLPKWFETINKDFCYQLTAIGMPGSNLHIEEEIAKNHFKIAGGMHGMKVSWQVTGTRKDPWANANRFKVEEEKRDNERDYYLHPELYNKSLERSIEQARYPDHKERLKKMQGVVEEANRREAKAKAMFDKER